MIKNKRLVLKWLCIGTAVLLIVFIIGAWLLFGNFIKAAGTIQKLEDGLYSMEYNGDYGFDDFLAKGGASSDSAVADYLVGYLSRGFVQVESNVKTGEFGCSTICTSDKNGNIYFGRNFDWQPEQSIIVHTRPTNGYESFSTCCLSFLGFDEDYVPDGSMMERMQTLAAIYVPLDGMNEKGLMVADLIISDDEITHQQTDKTDLTTTTAIRLLLDKAATVDEAVALLAQYDMNSSADIAHHLSIADAGGKSVVVEYVNGEMLVTETKVVTNHYLADCEKKGVGSAQSHLRYETLSAYNDFADETAVRDLLKSVAQMNYPQSKEHYEKTLWSIVYSPESLSADLYFDENYEHCYGLQLKENGSFIKK